MTPNRADLLPADALPNLLTVQDLVGGHDEFARLRLDSFGNGRDLPIDFAAKEAEQRKSAANDKDQRRPQLSITLHDGACSLVVEGLGEQDVVFEVNVVHELALKFRQAQVQRLPSAAGFFGSHVVRTQLSESLEIEGRGRDALAP